MGVKWIYRKNEWKRRGCQGQGSFSTQECGVDYSKVLAPLTSHDTIRMIISLFALNKWNV